MKATAWFDVACNDPDNGVFDGKTHAITYRMWDGEYVELEADDWNGYAFTEIAGGIRLHRRVFSIEGSKDWVGNWCWNGYKLSRTQAKRLIGTLRESGRWRCTHGPCAWYDWFNREGRFSFQKPERK
jgi:hypothetical protein